MDAHEESSQNTLKVGADRYRILRADGDVSVGNDEYLNKLIIDQAILEDAGLYICFVTNSGFGALTYKAMTLRVEPRKFIFFIQIAGLIITSIKLSSLYLIFKNSL